MKKKQLEELEDLEARLIYSKIPLFFMNIKNKNEIEENCIKFLNKKIIQKTI